MARICPLFSGSSGNSTYFSTATGGLLVDAGVSFKRLCDALLRAGGTLEGLRGILITHEHTDHIAGLPLLLKKCNIPVLGSARTLATLEEKGVLPPTATQIALDDTAAVGDFSVARFDTSHDCPGSSGYVITLPSGERAAVCTDLGVVSDTVRNALTGCEFVLLESNHDVNMLQKGPYPAPLKLRILSDRGHLSNAACAAFLPELVRSGTTRLVLGHLSRQNNTPPLALSTAKAALCDADITVGRDCLLSVASPCDNEVTAL